MLLFDKLEAHLRHIMLKAVIDYIAGFDDAKMDINGCNQNDANLFDEEQV